MALEITDANFEEVVLKSSQPVLVDFWAEWCGPCRMLGPIIEELSSDYDGKAVIGKVDVDSNQQYAAQFGVRNIPTVLIFNPTPKFLRSLSFVSLVKLFLRELVATSPRGLLFANDIAAGGLSLRLSLSSCG